MPSPVLSLVVYLLLGFAGAVLTLAVRAQRRSLKFLQGPPSPSLLLGHESDFNRVRKVGSLEDDWFNQYGTAFRMAGCYGENVLMLCDPKAIQHIFHKSGYQYIKPKDVEHNINRIFGPGLVTVGGQVHQRQRKLLNPAFSAAQIKPFAEVFASCTKSLILKWQEEIDAKGSHDQTTSIDTVRWLPNMTLDALGETFFEYEFCALQGKKSSALCDIIRDLFVDSHNLTDLEIIRLAAYRFLPDPIRKVIDIKKTREDKRFGHWLETSRRVADDLIKLKMDGSESEGKNDFMSILSRALYTSDPGKSMSTIETLSQMATIIFAGHETSASTLNWVLYELAKHPKEQEVLFQEIKNIREQTGNESDPLSVKDLEGPEMAHLNRVIKETLRFHPIVPELIRQADIDDVIPLEYPVMDASGSVLTQIPVVKGQRLNISIHHYNRVKQMWGEDADEWNPSRFTDHKKPTTLGVFGNLMTFSGGVRSCIGWRFAVLEVQVILAALVESFVFSFPEGIEIQPVRSGLLVSPMVKGRWKEGFQMPLIVGLRAGAGTGTD